MAVDQADGAETSAIPNVVSFPYYIRNGSQRIKVSGNCWNCVFDLNQKIKTDGDLFL